MQEPEPVPAASEQQPQQGYINWQQPQSYGQPQQGANSSGLPTYGQPTYGPQGTAYAQEPQKNEEDENKPSEGGRFSHMPDNFDNK